MRSSKQGGGPGASQSAARLIEKLRRETREDIDAFGIAHPSNDRQYKEALAFYLKVIEERSRVVADHNSLQRQKIQNFHEFRMAFMSRILPLALMLIGVVYLLGQASTFQEKKEILQWFATVAAAYFVGRTAGVKSKSKDSKDEDQGESG